MDYDDISYPIPFGRLLCDPSTHYIRYRNDTMKNVAVFEEVEEYKEGNDLLMMTAATSNHHVVAQMCLLTMVRFCPYSNILFGDMGLTEDERNTMFNIAWLIYRIHRMLNSSAIFYYRLLDLNHFPLWVQNTKDFAGVYSLKLYVGLDAAMQWKANIGIIDAGSNLIRAPLNELQYVKKEGIYSPWSIGYVKNWVHPLSKEFLIHYGIVDSIDANGRNCCGGHIFFDYRNSTVREKVLIPMQLCAYTHACLVPRGSNRLNHRQDQAIWSVLLNNLHLKYSSNLQYSHHSAKFWTDKYINASSIKYYLNKTLEGVYHDASARII